MKKGFISSKILTSLILSLLVIFSGIVPGTLIEAEANHYTESKMYSLHLLSSSERSWTYNLMPGSVVIMHPGSDRTVYRFSDAENRIKNNSVGTVVMAGVGSSSLGTAAMAKQMANVLGEPVAGIVTGWGESTVWYYGTQGAFAGRLGNINGTYYSNAASYTLYTLYLGGARPYRVIGHSKGSFDTANALFRLRNEGRSGMYSQTTFISLGIGVNRPSGLANYRGYLGTVDTLGELNTTNWTNLIRVSGADHHINPNYSNYLPITSSTLAR